MSIPLLASAPIDDLPLPDELDLPRRAALDELPELPADTVLDAPAMPDDTVLDDSPIDETQASSITSALPSQASASIRTITPLLVGWLLATIARVLGTPLPAGAEEWATQAVPVMLAGGYWLVARALEHRWPGIPWLGSTRHPVYAAPGINSLAASSLTTYNGKRFSAAAAASLRELDRLTPDISIVFAQGGWNAGGVSASAGTHDRDAVDISVNGMSSSKIARVVSLLRCLGWAAWYRPNNWDRRGGGAHIHAVPNRGPGMYLSSGADDQVDQYRAGHNGLASWGPDNQLGATSAYRTRTWADYQRIDAANKASAGPAKAKAKAKPPISWKMYSEGQRTGHPNGNVRIIQQLLLRQGKQYLPGGVCDGICGPQTRAGIRAWQLAVGYSGSSADGLLGPIQFGRIASWGGYTPVA